MEAGHWPRNHWTAIGRFVESNLRVIDLNVSKLAVQGGFTRDRGDVTVQKGNKPNNSAALATAEVRCWSDRLQSLFDVRNTLWKALVVCWMEDWSHWLVVVDHRTCCENWSHIT